MHSPLIQFIASYFNIIENGQPLLKIWKINFPHSGEKYNDIVKFLEFKRKSLMIWETKDTVNLGFTIYYLLEILGIIKLSLS